MGQIESSNLKQFVSTKETKSELRTRRLRYQRHKEQEDWESSPPDGSDVGNESYKVKVCTPELIANCKTFPPLRFPELHKQRDKKEDEEKPKETILERLRKLLKTEQDEETKFAALLKKRENSLKLLESKWLKNNAKCVKKLRKEVESFSNDETFQPPGWFTRFLKEKKGIIALGRLLSPPHPTAPKEVTEFSSRTPRVIIRTNKAGKGAFRVFEQYRNPTTGKWKTTFKCTDARICQCDGARVSITGEFGLPGQSAFDLMVVNKERLDSNHKLRGAYVRRVTSHPDMLTWIMAPK